MSAELALGRVTVGEGRPAVTIAEAACEHLGSLEVAKRMAEIACEVGADVIKYQMHVPEEMIAGSIQFWGGSMDEVLARYNLTVDDHRELMAHCERVGIQYLCTPFSARAGELLDELGAVGFKTGSGELTNLPMQRSLARRGKPMIVSTGMATMEEIGETVAVLKEEGAPFMLTHCTSAYPPRYEEINLGFIPVLREATGVMVGFSDHTPDIWTALGAVVIGAPVVEKHFTLDRSMRGPDSHVSLEPEQFRTMVDAIRKLEAAMGAEKRVHEDERVVRHWAHHSVVTLRPIAKGTVISAEAVGVKRPGWGVPAKHLEEFIGLVAQRDLPADALLAWEDVA